MGRLRSPEFRAEHGQWEQDGNVRCFAQRCQSTSTRAVLVSVGGLFRVAMVLCERHQRLLAEALSPERHDSPIHQRLGLTEELAVLEDQAEQPREAALGGLRCVRDGHEEGPHLTEDGRAFTIPEAPPGASPRPLEQTG